MKNTIFLLLVVLLSACGDKNPKATYPVSNALKKTRTEVELMPVQYGRQIESIRPPSRIPAPGEDWEVVATDQRGNKFAISPSTVTRQGNVVSFWQAGGAGEMGGFVVYQSIDCNRGLIQVQKGFSFDLNRNITSRTENPAEVINIRTGTIAATIHQTVCTTKSPEQTIIDAQIEALSRNREINAEMINNSTRTIMEMFR